MRKDFKVTSKFSGTFVHEEGAFKVEWNCKAPVGLEGELFDKYVRKRNSFLEAVSIEIGRPVTVLDRYGISKFTPHTKH